MNGVWSATKGYGYGTVKKTNPHVSFRVPPNGCGTGLCGFRMEALSRFEPGTVVPLQSKHVFTLEKRLGRGAEGVVFLAQLEQDEEKGEPGSQPIYAAVKILAPRLHASHDVDDERKRLAMAALSGKLGERCVTAWRR